MIATTGFLIASALASAAPPPAAAPAPDPYAGLFTRWTGANEEALRAEASRAAPAAAAAGPLRAGTPELGARVGEIVRAGDCEEGERVARAAGDFPLVDAVRAHCRSRAVQAVSRR